VRAGPVCDDESVAVGACSQRLVQSWSDAIFFKLWIDPIPTNLVARAI
jgi:hypothetical protein